MKTIKVKWTGIRPLVMSNPQTVDVENIYSVESRRLNSAVKDARKKQDEATLIELAREQKKHDFMASAYFNNEESRFFLPDTVILACIKNGAQSMKKGKDIDRGVLVEEMEPFVSGVPDVKSLADAYNNEAFRLETPAKIPPKTGALMWKVRCMMPIGWVLSFGLTYDPDFITNETMVKILNRSGLFVGIGGWRPKFGRFLVEI